MEGVPRSKESSPRERLIHAARALFAEHGVEGISTEVLARDAKVSKASLYKHFGGKSELFAAIIDADVDEFNIPPDLDFNSADEFFEHVVQFGLRLTRLLARPDIQRMTSAMIKHAATDPKTAQLFFERTIEVCRAQLAKLIQRGIDRGHVRRDIPAMRRATHLLSLWEGIDHYRYQLGLNPEPTAKTPAVVRECVQLVLQSPPPT